MSLDSSLVLVERGEKELDEWAAMHSFSLTHYAWVTNSCLHLPGLPTGEMFFLHAVFEIND